jgi:hypothetical protein
MEPVEEKIAKVLRERRGEIDEIKRLPDDRHPLFLKWWERLLSNLKEGVRQRVVRPELVGEIEIKQFVEPRFKMFDEPERSHEDRNWFLRDLDDIAVKLEVEVERIEDFGGWVVPEPPRKSRTRPASSQNGPVTIHARDIIGGMQFGGRGNTITSAARWDNPEVAGALEKLIGEVETISEADFHERAYMLELLTEMKGAKQHHRYLEIADQVGKFVKLAPALKWVWEAAKPHLGL